MTHSSHNNENRLQKPDKVFPAPLDKDTQSIAFSQEVRRLSRILALLHNSWQESENAILDYQKEYIAAKRYMAEYRHEVDPKEIFQQELLLGDINRAGNIQGETKERLAKLIDSPYFSRIDFRAHDGDGAVETFYIGRFNFHHQGKILIYDWRAPVSSMFYDYELGEAGFDAPIGRITGELLGKRQLKIIGGQLIYVLESSTYIQDDILQQELSGATDEKMKTIVTSLQREQNAIVRDEKADIFIIQGVAGSGKTSVALHRIAFLLYRCKNSLSARNIAILSPNKVFGSYISNVLPELGEEPIYALSLIDLAQIQLEKIMGFQPEKDPAETKDGPLGERSKLKSSLAFLKQLEEYLKAAVQDVFQPCDYVFDGFTIEKSWISRRYMAYKNHSVLERLKEVASDIHDRLETDNYMAQELPKERSILTKLKTMLVFKTTLDLYQDFYQKAGLQKNFILPDKKTLEWQDVYPFLYVHAFFQGLKKNYWVQHLVIDEMQDYSPVQYAVLKKLFQCKMTITGDFGQSVNPHQDYSLQDLHGLFPNAKTVSLNKSYRSTFEIIQMANYIKPAAQLIPVERHGKAPEVIHCPTPTEELLQIKKALDEFLKSSAYTSLGILLKTATEARAMHQALAGAYLVNLITSQSRDFSRGITITSVQMSKGLEFDQVLIPSADKRNYAQDYDRNLLYIACTRALHRLTLFYCGQHSVFLPNPSE